MLYHFYAVLVAENMEELTEGLRKCKDSIESKDFRINPSRFDPGQREQINLFFIFTLLCGASRGFMEALKVLIQLSKMHGAGRINRIKAKVMISDGTILSIRETCANPCSVWYRGVKTKSIFCGPCNYWVHKKCCSLNGWLWGNENHKSKQCIRKNWSAGLYTSRTWRERWENFGGLG